MALTKGEMWRTDCIGEGTFSRVVRRKIIFASIISMITFHDTG